MTRVLLAAGVAALAISAPASAQRGERDRNNASEVKRDRADRQQQRAQRAERPQRVERQAQRAERPQRAERQAQRVERAERPQRAERVREQRVDRPARVERQAQRMERADRPARVERQAQRMERADRPARVERQAVERRADRQVDRSNVRMTDRQQVRANRVDRLNDRMEMRAEQRIERAQARAMDRTPALARRVAAFKDASTTFPIASRARGRAFIDGCPPGLWMKNNGCMPPGQAAKLLGAPLGTVGGIVTLNALPNSLNYLYPETPNYYYRYGDGYLYQVDRSNDLIAALIPLIAGGFIPGQYLPSNYMNSYVPNYYGLSSFYPSSYGSYGSGYDYGYGYNNLCNRYANGVVYQVDCGSGMIENVVPLYTNGYGVGQMLPSAYGYYNVPNQYRSLYYDTGDYGYRYAPGAIYQYDTSSSLITSVAALLSPGFTVGQPLPMGYDTYNVPYAYRQTYYDSPNAWYRYNNGYIYQVDPATQLVTSIVRSILT